VWRGVFPRRQRRLAGESYVGYQRYFVTTCTALRRPVFKERWLATDVTACLLQNAASFDFTLPAYCVMPDHVHVLLHATSDRADLLAFMKRFKQLTGFAYRRQTCQALWQVGYHERILRDDESSETVARYILENPIRAGLSNQWGEYPYAWSDVYDLEALFTDWNTRRPQSHM
jgi:REP element-mobilizing transposase RayT